MGAFLAACGLKPTEESPMPEPQSGIEEPRINMGNPELPSSIEKPRINIDDLINSGLLRSEEKRFFSNPFVMEEKSGRVIWTGMQQTLLTIYDIQRLETEIQQGNLVLVEFTETTAALFNFPPAQRRILAIRTPSGNIIPAYWLNPQKLAPKFEELSNLKVVQIDEETVLKNVAQIVKEKKLGVEIKPGDLIRIGKEIRLPKNWANGRVLGLRYGVGGNNREWIIFLYTQNGEYSGFITVPPNVFVEEISNKLKDSSSHYNLRHSLDDVILGESFSNRQISGIVFNNIQNIFKNLSNPNLQEFEIERFQFRVLNRITLGNSRTMYVVEISEEGRSIIATFHQAGNFYHFYLNNAISSRFSGTRALLSAQEYLSQPYFVPSILGIIRNLTAKYSKILTGLTLIPSIFFEFQHYSEIMKKKVDFWANLDKEEREKLLALGTKITSKDESLKFNYTLPITGLILIDEAELAKAENNTRFEFPVYLVEGFFPDRNQLKIFEPESESFNSSYYGVVVLKVDGKYYLIVENERGCFSIDLSKKEQISEEEYKTYQKAGIEIIHLKNGKILVVFNLKPEEKK